MRDVYVLRDMKSGTVYAVATRFERCSEAAGDLPAGVVQSDLTIENFDLLEDDD